MIKEAKTMNIHKTAEAKEKNKIKCIQAQDIWRLQTLQTAEEEC